MTGSYDDDQDDLDGAEPGWTIRADGHEVVIVSGCGRVSIFMPVEGAREFAAGLLAVADAIDAEALDLGAELLGGG